MATLGDDRLIEQDVRQVPEGRIVGTLQARHQACSGLSSRIGFTSGNG